MRGSVLLDSDRLELDDGDERDAASRWTARGSSTASPAAMGELMSAVAEGREPENSAADAARRSAGAGRPRVRRAGGAPVDPASVVQ